MKPMIRKDREITDLNEQLAIIDACDVCRIALNDPETGFPYVVPLNFGVDVQNGQVTLYFHSARRGTKLDLIAQDNRATFEMDCDHQFIFYDERMSCTMGYRSVIGHGLIEILPDEERTHGLDILMRHYHAEEYPHAPLSCRGVYLQSQDGACHNGLPARCDRHGGQVPRQHPSRREPLDPACALSGAQDALGKQ